ncbi:hypothetical protein GCM10018785_53200 [Streptomyces longispororuber]|uniref:Uncharacterized protein n=1 Tax=Streptomyces longispororuber TaxID=68230 RepID=A0A918ZZG9_9ACTN|nr:hypothetical protein [Streptomyces longispororuber]GHE78401.1 hypothetical protein GCM10018785_53200 [Streptomyces longispororuber]
MTEDAPPAQALSAAFDGDLLTDYVPDALGAVDVRRLLCTGRPLEDPLHVGHLRVPLARRLEVVPVVSCAARARMLRLTEQALSAHVPRPEVFSYRSLDWRYRPAYQERQHHLRALAARGGLPLVLVLDVHRFGRSLPLDVLCRTPWMTERLAEALTALYSAAGRALLPGHRWANRLATAVLAPLDDAVASLAPGRWTRWGDDLHVFVRDHAEADDIRAAAAAVLRRLGLRLSAEKSTVTGAASVLTRSARVIRGRAQDVWRSGLSDGDVQALRYALPRTPPDDTVSRTLVGAVRDHPGLLPRAVHYLDRAAHSPAARAAAEDLLLTAEPDAFAAARLLPLAARHPGLVPAVPDALLAVAEESEVGPLRELAFRVAVSGGRRHTWPPTPRMRGRLAQGAELARDLPDVNTLL